MASVREYRRADGKISHQVLFRHGSRQRSRSFEDAKSAAEFKGLVDLLGPDRALKITKGEGDTGPVLTVADLADKYLTWKRSRITIRTAKDYERDIERWIKPHLGHLAADQLDERDVQGWVDKRLTPALAPKTVADKHMILHSMYEFGKAKTRRLVTQNPCRETELPKRAKRTPPKGTTVPEFRAILEAAKQNPDAHDLILYLGETGWRFSEATALMVRDVEDDGTDVWTTVTQVFRVDDRGRQYLAAGEAKTSAAFRRIRMFPDTAAMIRRRMVGRGPGDHLFTNSRGNHWRQNTFLRETWPAIVKRADLGDRKPTPHWLRHMHVAVCAAAKTPMHEIQRRIGHDNYATTVGVYGGMIGDMSDESMELAAALMAGKASAPNVAPVVEGEVIVGGIAAPPVAPSTS